MKPIFAAIAGNGGGQPSSGPMLSLNAISLNFGQATEGQASAPMAVTLSSVGNEAVSLTSIAITGSDPGDFAETDTCMSDPILAPKQSCSVSITYRPLGVGTRQATLSITDNSPGSPQIIPLLGTSVAPPTPTPITSFTPPGTFNIPGTVTVGMTSSPQNLVLTNTGNAPMHVTNIVLGGVNVNDFSLGTSTCVGTLAVNANCSIPIVFAPVAAGIRSSTITVTDDASASPQVVAVNGTAAQPVTIGAAGNGSRSASVAAGQTAQFLLQATPGPGFTGTLSLLARDSRLAPFALHRQA
ncbi:MAG TPA: choice-of-anchor D domain-containing protein [Candidatus Acidoferrum sp.]